MILGRSAPRIQAALVHNCCLLLGLAACGGGDGGTVTLPPVIVTPPPVVSPPVVVAPAPVVPVAYQALTRVLDSNPPSAFGSNSARTAGIAEFEGLLFQIDPTQVTPRDVVQYYEARMARVLTEMDQPVTTGFRVWAMFNHGFIVKTPTTTFAFDLIEGKTAWASAAWTVQLPQALLNQIDVLMVSHEHVDHWDLSGRIPANIKARGGAVLYPAGGLARAQTTQILLDKQVTQVRDLTITAHAGLHNAAVMVYEVVTGAGYRLVHTGDNQTSVSLPALQGVDVLLLNGWVNESGATSNIVGMRRSIEKLRPAVMIPGHFMEISRPKTGWYRYTEGLLLQNEALERTKTVVMTWGERLEYTQPACGAGLVRIYEACVSP
jgi:L-ascorbate metabolism protein UlaG (beta-lactamase superfamily)